MHRSGIAIALGAALLWPAAAQASGPRCGDTVTSDTTLTRPVRCTGNGLWVQSGVTLDLGGHTVYGDGTGIGVILREGATLRHGRVRGFETGVTVQNGRGTIEDATIARNTGRGIQAAGFRDTWLIVRRSLVAANGGDGMYLDFVAAQVSDSRFLRNGDYGVRAYNGDASRFERNAFTANRRRGLYVLRGTTVITGNSASRNGLDGIYVEDSIYNFFFYSLASNQANNNRRLGIWFTGTPFDPVSGRGVDSGGNRATGNRDPRQCVLIACARR
jgi:parallel beta-helix repeat protein